MRYNWRVIIAAVLLAMSIIFVIDLTSSISNHPATKPTISTETDLAPTESVTLPFEPDITEPTEPTEPTESFEPTEPTEPTEPEILCTVINVPKEYIKRSVFKSYENYLAITSTNTPHYKLQHNYAKTADNGIRTVNDRYCIALGSYFTKTIGQYIDVVLQNGTVIECILGDQKSDAHTEWPHVAHPDGSIVEFIIDKKVMDPYVVQITGNVSDLYEEWKSPVVQIIVYDRNFLMQ